MYKTKKKNICAELTISSVYKVDENKNKTTNYFRLKKQKKTHTRTIYVSEPNHLTIIYATQSQDFTDKFNVIVVNTTSFTLF